MSTNYVIGFYGAVLGMCDEVDKLVGIEFFTDECNNSKKLLNIRKYRLYV